MMLLPLCLECWTPQLSLTRGHPAVDQQQGTYHLWPPQQKMAVCRGRAAGGKQLRLPVERRLVPAWSLTDVTKVVEQALLQLTLTKRTRSC